MQNQSHPQPRPHLLLASASPRRRQLLENLAIAFETAASAYQEPPCDDSTAPENYVSANARGKARMAHPGHAEMLVIGADTAVIIDDEVLGKPPSPAAARSYLQRLNGREHRVATGLCLIDTRTATTVWAVETTAVRFRRLSSRDLDAYLGSINPLDKAGAYAIQGSGALLVETINGCYYNVVGFPLGCLDRLMRQVGLCLFDYLGTEPKPKIQDQSHESVNTAYRL